MRRRYTLLISAALAVLCACNDDVQRIARAETVQANSEVQDTKKEALERVVRAEREVREAKIEGEENVANKKADLINEQARAIADIKKAEADARQTGSRDKTKDIEAK